MWKKEAENAKGVFVIVHGAGEYHARYEWVVHQLTRLHYHVIIGDLPGQGTSEGRTGHIRSFSDYLDVVNRWLEEARTYKLPVVLLAHSMGGLIATRLLMSLPKSQLPHVVILSSPCLGLVNDPPYTRRAVSHLLNALYPQLRFPTGLKTGSGTRNEEIRKRDLNDPLLVKKVSVRWYKELVKSMKRAHQDVAQFPELPLLVTQGGEDLIVNKRAVRSWFDELQIKNKYYKEWDGFYHEVLNEPEREKVLAHLLGFVTLNIT